MTKVDFICYYQIQRYANVQLSGRNNAASGDGFYNI